MGTVLDTISYNYSNSEWGDLLISFDGNTIASDEIGNMLSDGTWTYTWEHGRELASMSDGTTTWNYTYDADGLRTKRTNGSTTYSYIYNGSSLSQMTVGSNTLYFAYDASGTPMSVSYNGTAYYYVTNIQGDVIKIVDSSGTTVVDYTYDAWGNILTTTGSMASTLGTINPLRYRGYVYDQETGLYYLQSRYYDPKINRYISVDTYIATGQGLLGNNMFIYCGNNPVDRIDITGQSYCKISIDSFNPLNSSLVNEIGGCGGGLVGGYVYAGSHSPREDNSGEDEASYAYYEVTGNTGGPIFYGKIFAIDSSGFSCSLEDWQLTLFSIHGTMIKGDFEMNNGDSISFLEFGNVDIGASAGLSGIDASCLFSLWSPSLNFDIGFCKMSLNFHVGSYGVILVAKKGKFEIGGDAPYGASISFEW